MSKRKFTVAATCKQCGRPYEHGSVKVSQLVHAEDHSAIILQFSVDPRREHDLCRGEIAFDIRDLAPSSTESVYLPIDTADLSFLRRK